jgi:hypothetical protein
LYLSLTCAFVMLGACLPLLAPRSKGDEVEYHKKSAGVWVQATIARAGSEKAGGLFYTVGVVFAK